MSKIEYNVPVGDQSEIAGMTVPIETIGTMYQNWESTSEDDIYVSPERESNGVRYNFINSKLNFTPRIDSDGNAVVQIGGNTVERNCSQKPEGALTCEGCALAGLGFVRRLDDDCAKANVEHAFGRAGIAPRERIMLTPTSNDVIVLGSETIGTPQMPDGELAFNKLGKGSMVIITEESLKELEIEKIGIGINGADATFGMMSVNWGEHRAVMAFCSQRSNMGDRSAEEEIYSRGFDALFDHFGLDESERQSAIEEMKIEVVAGASAKEPQDFRFNFVVPQLDSDDEKLQKRARRLLDEYNAAHDTNETVVTRLMVINDMYPGAVDSGNVYAPLEAGMAKVSKQMGIDISRKWDSECPEECCVDYSSETERTIRTQTRKMGIKDSQVMVDIEDAINTADIANNAASNRAEQLGGVKTSKTNRTLNAMVFSFSDR
jgi:hypothetical protein